MNVKTPMILRLKSIISYKTILKSVRLKNNPKFAYEMNGTQIQAAVLEKDLGIMIDNSAKPGLQCAAAAKKGNQVLGQLPKYGHASTLFLTIAVHVAM